MAGGALPPHQGVTDRSLEQRLNLLLELLGGNQLHAALIDLVGAAPGFIEPSLFSLALCRFVQTLKESLGELSALLQWKMQCSLFNISSTHC